MVSGLGVESYAISLAVFCAAAGKPASAMPDNNNGNKRFMIFSLRDASLCARGSRRLRLKGQLQHPPGFDFADNDLIGIAAIHHVHDLESGHPLRGMTKF